MLPRARPALAAAALCAMPTASVGAVSGCAETDELSDRLTKAQYLLELQRAFRQVRANADLPGRLIDARSPQELAAVIDEAAGELDELTARLEEVRPPDEVADLHNRLTALLRSFSDLFTESAQALEQGDYGALVGVPAEASDLSTEFADLSADYAKRGYEVDASAKGQP